MRDQVFVSYCRADKDWLDRLQTHLTPLIRAGAIDLWDDTRIKPGQDWRAEIDQALERAAVAVLLVTPEFLASKFIAEIELPALLRAARQGDLRIVWIPVKASSFDQTELGAYQAAWDPRRPLAELPAAKHDAAFVEICRAIRGEGLRCTEFRIGGSTPLPPPTPAQPPILNSVHLSPDANPFTWRAGITDGGAFFGRERELASLKSGSTRARTAKPFCVPPCAASRCPTCPASAVGCVSKNCWTTTAGSSSR